MVVLIGMKGWVAECPTVASSQIRPNVNRIYVGIRELEAQVESDPSLALNKDLGIKRDRFDKDVGSALTIFSGTNSSLREGFPQVLDRFFYCRLECHGLSVIVSVYGCEAGTVVYLHYLGIINLHRLSVV